MLTKNQKVEIVNKFGKNNADTGSTEVQVALLSERINSLTDHLRSQPKDFSSRRGLLKLVGQRRNFMNYLKNGVNMKVRITHSIDLEEVPKKVSEMLAPATRDIGNVVRWLENVQQDLESDSITPEMTVSLIERVRLVLGDADTALQEANNI